MGEAGFFGLFLAMGGIGVSFLLGPVGRALASRISGRRDPESGPSTGEIAADQVANAAHVANLEARMAELEERVDFAERLLSKPADETRTP